MVRKRKMAIDKKQEYSQIGLTKKRSRQKKDDKLCSLVPPTTFKSVGSQSSTDAPVIIIIDDDDEKKPLVPMKKKKKKKSVSWWDGLNSVVKGSLKSKDAASSVDSRFSSTTNLHETKTKKEENERSSSSVHHGIVIDLCKNERSHHYNFFDLNEDVIVGEGPTYSSTGNRHVSIEELGVSMEDLKSWPWEAFDRTWEIRSETMDPWLGGYIKDTLSAH